MTEQSVRNGSLFAEIHSLVMACLEGVATKAQFAKLDDLVYDDPEARRLYVQYLSDAMCLRYIALPLQEVGVVSLSPDMDTDISFNSLYHSFLHFPTSFLSTTFHGTIGYFSHEIPFSFLVGAVFTSLLVLIAWLVPVSSLTPITKNLPTTPAVVEPNVKLVGKITGMVDCKWFNPATAPVGDNVSIGRKYALASGLMEITYDTGAKVILRGPVTYEVRAKDGGYLSLGKLTAKLEKKAEGGRWKVEESNPQSRIPTPSFFVRTPTAVVTDLGTEFSVEVSKEGHTTSHVFRGMVKVQAVAADGNVEGNAQVLHENQSARVEKNDGNQNSGNRITVFVTPIGLVREILRPTINALDLVDVVAGGDGFSGRRNRGINQTGRIIDKLPKEGEISTGDGRYHRVEGMPLVDGVFIPGRDAFVDPVQVDSAGHTFDVFGKTSNKSPNGVWAGGVLPVPICQPWAIISKLGGIDYATSGHGLLFLHANQGVTFDLDAIRRANPQERLLRFRAMAGNTEAVSNKGNGDCYADFWVLVDGQSRYQRRKINSRHGAFSVVVPLAEKDRFLTLVATDGGDDMYGDWIVFGDPRLELLDHTAVGSDFKTKQ